MLIGQSLGCFQFEDKHVINDNVRKVFPDYGSVFIINIDGLLLTDVVTGFFQPVDQCVLIDFLQMVGASVLKKKLNQESRKTGIAVLILSLPGFLFSKFQISLLCIFSRKTGRQEGGLGSCHHFVFYSIVFTTDSLDFQWDRGEIKQKP
jgi:hypothetical protein